MELVNDPYAVTLLFISLVLSAIWFVRNSRWWKYRLAPGPIGVPIFGILPYIDPKNPAIAIREMSRRYGTVFSGNLGDHHAVFLNDYDTIKEAFSRSDDTCNDRPRIASLELYSNGQGVATCFYENHWKEQRRFALRVLRNFGMGRAHGVVTEAIECEAGHFVDEWAKLKGPFDPTDSVGMAICNVTCKFGFGRRFSYDNPDFCEFVHALDKVFELANVGGLINYLGILKYVPYSGYGALNDASRHLENGLFLKECLKHRQQFSPDRKPEDIIDCFLQEIDKRKTEKDSSPTGFTDKQLIHFMADIFAAGTDTTTTSIKWALLHLTKFVDLQAKVQEELDRVVGRDRMPAISDKPYLVYTQAFLAESMRYSCIATFGVPHGAKEDTTLHGYDIPKGSVVMPNLWAVCHDPKTFPNPDVFDPMRFVDAEGQIIPSLLERVSTQFGIGRRACVGEQIAQVERFTFVSHVLHRYSLSAPGGPASVNLAPAGGLTCKPHDYKMIATPRPLGEHYAAH
ncbi:cytochrome P450 2J6-like [Diadema setosum]|uniref:cytochrome P450 2J6-like n=1 Tax=Diadema setosum TaxID=31175 RepID=UPI003B3A2653